MNSSQIMALLPYRPPFLFVDELEEVNEHGSKGSYTFPVDAYFYQGHFKDNPVTPGVILTECMAQVGVVSLGIFLMGSTLDQHHVISMSNTHVDFYIPVFPGEKVAVVSEKIYFRFNKLKCSVKMRNEDGQLVCKGEISGMINKKG